MELNSKMFLFEGVGLYRFFFSFQSWETMPSETATFTSDITPLILAAHRDNYEIIKILLDRGCTLSLPHDARYLF